MNRENKRLEERLHNTQGKEINAVFNKLIDEFNPIYSGLTMHNPTTGLIDVHPDLEKHLDKFNKRWNAWRSEYLKHKTVYLKIKTSAFLDYVTHDLEQRSKNAFSIWKEDLQKILDKNTKVPLKINLDLYKGQELNSCAHDILVKHYYTVPKYNRWLCIKNYIRQLFKYEQHIPAIQVL
jgi:hypothetical protein